MYRRAGFAQQYTGQGKTAFCSSNATVSRIYVYHILKPPLIIHNHEITCSITTRKVNMVPARRQLSIEHGIAHHFAPQWS
jgi:hypothetical protein